MADGERLLSAEVAHRKPLGWGPFVVEEWVEGEHITLVRNPRYFRASEGLPYLDGVEILFIPDPMTASLAMQSGEGDALRMEGSKIVADLIAAGFEYIGSI